MKKLLSTLLVLVISTTGFAGVGGVPDIPMVVKSVLQTVEKPLEFGWIQTTIPSDMAGWEIHQADVSCGPYVLAFDIPYVETQTEYSTEEPFIVPDNVETTYFWVILAKDTDGNKSGFSNEVFWKFDYMAPGIPITFTVKIVAE